MLYSVAVLEAGSLKQSPSGYTLSTVPEESFLQFPAAKNPSAYSYLKTSSAGSPRAILLLHFTYTVFLLPALTFFGCVDGIHTGLVSILTWTCLYLKRPHFQICHIHKLDQFRYQHTILQMPLCLPQSFTVSVLPHPPCLLELGFLIKWPLHHYHVCPPTYCKLAWGPAAIPIISVSESIEVLAEKSEGHMLALVSPVIGPVLWSTGNFLLVGFYLNWPKTTNSVMFEF